MATLAISPFAGGHSGSPDVEWYPVGTETFNAGDPVGLDAAGELDTLADDPTAANLLGIACTSGDATDGVTFRTPGFGPFNASDPQTPVAGDMVGVWIPTSEDRFITSNFSAAGSAFGDVAPVAADVGDEVSLALIGGVWGVTQANSNNVARITRVLDEDKNDVKVTGNTGVWVVFRILASMNTSASAPTAAD